MRTVGRSVLITALALAATSARADEFAEANARAVRQNPAGVVLRLSTPKARYALGERIPVELAFEDTAARPGGWSVHVIAEGSRVQNVRHAVDQVAFQVSPAEGWTDPLELERHHFEDGGYMGAADCVVPLAGCRRVLDLNEWVRFDRPGTYRVECRVGWVQRDGALETTTTSTILELELVAADAAFERATIARAREQLARDLGDEPESDAALAVLAARREAARALAFLATNEAMAALLRAPGEDLAWVRYAGLIGARDRAGAVAAIVAAVAGPEVAADDACVRAWQRLTATATAAPPPPADDAPWDAWVAWEQDAWERQAREEHRVRRFLLERVAAALPAKEGGAFATTCELLALRGTSAVDPALRWRFPGPLADHVAERFVALPPSTQRALLHAWPVLRAPSWRQPLVQVVEGSPDTAVDLRSDALLCLADLAPEFVRTYVLREWPLDRARATPLLRPDVLLAFPAGSFPLDAVLVDRLRSSDEPGDLEVLGRHGEPDLLPWARSIARSRPDAWPLLCLWIRHDRAAGLAYTFERHGTIPPEVVSRIEWGLDVEARLIQGLTRPDGYTWRALQLLAERWSAADLVAWWQALDPARRAEMLPGLLHEVSLDDAAVERVEAALRTPGERSAFAAFERRRAVLRELGE